MANPNNTKAEERVAKQAAGLSLDAAKNAMADKFAGLKDRAADFAHDKIDEARSYINEKKKEVGAKEGGMADKAKSFVADALDKGADIAGNFADKLRQ